jgi:hypothetical protein
MPLRVTTSDHHEIGDAGFASHIHYGNVPSFTIIQSVYNKLYQIIGIHKVMGLENNSKSS